MNLEELFTRVEVEFDRVIDVGRKRSRVFDRVWTALVRFGDVLGGRLAAAISYYGFFAAFSLAVLAYSIIGRLLGSTSAGVLSTVNDYLNRNLPLVAQTAQQVGHGEVTALASIALVFSGIGWVEALRSSLRAVWLVDQHPGNWLLRRIVDLGMLVLLGLLLGLSIAVTAALNAVLGAVVPGETIGGFGPVIEFGINVLLASAMLTAVSRMRLSFRRLVTPALVVAVGIQLLNTVGRLFINRTEHRVAYVVVTSSVGLLVYLYVLNWLLLFGAALAATGEAGTAVDLGGGAAGLGAVGRVVPGEDPARTDEPAPDTDASARDGPAPSGR